MKVAGWWDKAKTSGGMLDFESLFWSLYRGWPLDTDLKD